MPTTQEIDALLWQLVGQKKPELVRYWYNQLMRMKNAQRELSREKVQNVSGIGT
jgi:hypothetical protein